MLRPILSLLALLLLAGCAGSGKRQPVVPPQVRSRELYEVDRNFSRLAAEQGAAVAFGQFSEAQSLRLNPAGPNVVGRSAFMAELRELPPGALVWTPRFAEVSLSGELGWTWGDFVTRSPRGERQGRYLTVWRMTPQGWRIAADIGTEAVPRP
jgi:hypothetical protein